MRDPRHVQVLALAGLLGYGIGWLDFAPDWQVYTVYLLVALGWQWGLSHLAGLGFDPRSPLISGLSLSLLLHTDSLLWAGLAASVAIVSKFVVRVDGRHVFNPANLAIVTLLQSTDRMWVTPGQWGRGPFLSFGAVCLGLWVLTRTRRSDVTLAFLLAWGGLVIGRAVWLGDPLSIPWWQLQNISLLIFAFFMISDPKTVPDRDVARIFFAIVVAGGGYVLQYHCYLNEGLFYALAVSAPLVPVLNRRWPGLRYRWPLNSTTRR